MRVALPTILLSLVATAACGTAAAAELPIADFVRLPQLTDPAISPDGRHLAVVVNAEAGSTKASYQIAIVQLPGMHPVGRLETAGHYVSAQIEWVSDTRLVVELRRGIGSLASTSWVSNIIAVNSDGSDAKTMYFRGPRNFASRGGEHPEDGTFPGIEAGNLLQGVPVLAGTPHPADGHFFLDIEHVPHGARDTPQDVWQRGSTRLYDVDASTGRAAEIGEIDHPDMTLMAYGGRARIAAGRDADLRAVAYASVDGRHWTPMPTATVGKVFRPLAISRDGRHLYALSSLDGDPDQLVSCRLDGTGRTVLASDPVASVTGTMWNPGNGEPIAAVFTAQGKPRVQYLGDGPYVQVVRAIAHGQPGEFVALHGASADGSRLLITMASDRDPGDWVLFNRANSRAQLLFREAPWIVPSQMPPRLPIHFRNRGGTELDGFLTLPDGAADRHLPLVLIPHGGPIGIADTWFFNPWAALLADRGYAVLQVNYRGSAGRGENFRRAGDMQFGTGIQDDLIDGVQWAIASGYADPKRICVFGGSFGGYSALMQPILAPQLYRCAIDYAGIYDWRIELHKSDASLSAFGRDYWQHAVGDDAQAYAISPAGMLDRFNVPVLIAHGEDDPRVPFANATELRAALTKAGKPFEWLAKPDEGHGFISENDNERLFGMILAFLGRSIGPGQPAAPTGTHG